MENKSKHGVKCPRCGRELHTSPYTSTSHQLDDILGDALVESQDDRVVIKCPFCDYTFEQSYWME